MQCLEKLSLLEPVGGELDLAIRDTASFNLGNSLYGTWRSIIHRATLVCAREFLVLVKTNWQESELGGAPRRQSVWLRKFGCTADSYWCL